MCEDAADFKDIESAQKAIESLSGGSYGNGKFGSTTIDEVLEAVDENGNTVGYVFAITNRNAYNPPLKLALGVDPDGKILKIAFIELNETPGKGSKADEPAFKDQFVGKTDASAVDTMSGATVTSKAVLNAVNAGLDFFQSVIMEGGN